MVIQQEEKFKKKVKYSELVPLKVKMKQIRSKMNGINYYKNGKVGINILK